MERRVPFQKHVGQLSPYCYATETGHFSNYIPVIVILISFQGEKGRKKWCEQAHIHTAKAYLQCKVGGRAGAAVCEIEPAMSPKDSAKAWGEIAK